MNSNVEYDVIVLGASVAGSTSAYLLGSAGLQVLILDPRSFPRQKACGEGLSRIGYNYLQKLDLWDHELESNAYPFYGYSIHFSQRRGPRIAHGRTPQGYGISRLMLDTYIQCKATAQPGVSIRNDAAKKATRKDGIWEVTVSDDEIIRAKHVVFASGASTSKLLDGVTAQHTEEPRCGIAFWADGAWSRESPTTVMIFNEPEGQYIITPLSKQRVNFSLLLYQKRGIAFKKAELVRKAQGLALQAGFTISKVTDTIGAAAIDHMSLSGHENRAFVIGDAIERFDPIGGMGMTHALFSAECASSAILDIEKGRRSYSEGLRKYYRVRTRGARVLKLLGDLSAGLNIQQHKFVLAFARKFPLLTVNCMDLVKFLFPRSVGISAFRSQSPVDLLSPDLKPRNFQSLIALDEV